MIQLGKLSVMHYPSFNVILCPTLSFGLEMLLGDGVLQRDIHSLLLSSERLTQKLSHSLQVRCDLLPNAKDHSERENCWEKTF